MTPEKNDVLERSRVLCERKKTQRTEMRTKENKNRSAAAKDTRCKSNENPPV